MTTNNIINVPLSGSTGTGNFVGANTPTLITPALGVATATSINFGGSALSRYAATVSSSPSITFATPGDLSVSYAVQNGFYSVVGNIVVYSFQVSFTPTYTTASGNIQITGLPFAAASTNSYGAMASSAIVYTGGFTFVNSRVVAGNTFINVTQNGSAVNSAFITATNVPTGVAYSLYGTLIYLI